MKQLCKSLGVIILVLLVGIAIIPRDGAVVTRSAISGFGSLTMSKLLTNATAISACTTLIATNTGSLVAASGTLYGKITIVLNLTWTQSNQTYNIALTSFFLIITQKNMVVGNSTNINQKQNPNNVVQIATLFPNIPLILIISFLPVCVTPQSIAQLIYIDGTFNFVFDLP